MLLVQDDVVVRVIEVIRGQQALGETPLNKIDLLLEHVVAQVLLNVSVELHNELHGLLLKVLVEDALRQRVGAHLL